MSNQKQMYKEQLHCAHGQKRQVEVHVGAKNHALCVISAIGHLAVVCLVNWGPFLEAPGNYRAC